MIEILGLIAATAMPLWNIPLVIRIWRRKSSEDLSMLWVIGVWTCIMGMLPSAIVSKDWTFRIFGVVNAVLFSLVFAVALKFRRKK